MHLMIIKNNDSYKICYFAQMTQGNVVKATMSKSLHCSITYTDRFYTFV